jgi:hypothetical protein
MSVGEVRDCAHCQGTGFCNSGNMPCLQCYNAGNCAGVRRELTNVTCAACGGKGSVWIGPQTVYIRGDE